MPPQVAAALIQQHGERQTARKSVRKSRIAPDPGSRSTGRHIRAVADGSLGDDKNGPMSAKRSAMSSSKGQPVAVGEGGARASYAGVEAPKR